MFMFMFMFMSMFMFMFMFMFMSVLMMLVLVFVVVLMMPVCTGFIVRVFGLRLYWLVGCHGVLGPKRLLVMVASTATLVVMAVLIMIVLMLMLMIVAATSFVVGDQSLVVCFGGLAHLGDVPYEVECLTRQVVVEVHLHIVLIHLHDPSLQLLSIGCDHGDPSVLYDQFVVKSSIHKKHVFVQRDQ